LVKKIKMLSEIPVFIMSYANIVYFHGMDSFIKRCTGSGVTGIIIPDIPPDFDEGLYLKAREKRLVPVPVLAISMSKERLKSIVSSQHEFVYAILRKGITGKYTYIGEENINFLKQLNSSGSNILAGFGISTKEQVTTLAPYTHAVVVGSAFISCFMEEEKRGGTDCYSVVYKKMFSLHY